MSDDDFLLIRKALSWVGYNSPNESDRLRAFDAETDAKNALSAIEARLADTERERDDAEGQGEIEMTARIAAEARIAHLEGALREGAESLNAFRRDKVCAYLAEDVVMAGKANFICDCKYGRAEFVSPGSEQTGCPELRVIVTSLRAALAASPTMTEEE